MVSALIKMPSALRRWQMVCFRTSPCILSLQRAPRPWRHLDPTPVSAVRIVVLPLVAEPGDVSFDASRAGQGVTKSKRGTTEWRSTIRSQPFPGPGADPDGEWPMTLQFASDFLLWCSAQLRRAARLVRRFQVCACLDASAPRSMVSCRKSASTASTMRMAVYKIGILLFCLVPYVALRILSSRAG
jgi:hypothetical protein